MEGQRTLQNGISQLPTKQKDRICTDTCCLITGLLFSIAILVTAIILFNLQTFYKLNFPTDSDGNLCGEDLNNYQYTYFSNAPQINPRVCVNKCPVKGDIALSCHPNSKVSNCNFSPSNKYFQTVTSHTRLGFYCFPADQVIAQKLKQNANLLGKQQFLQSLDAIILSSLAALGLSFCLFISVQFLPKIMNYLIVILAMVGLCATAFIIFSFQTEQKLLRTLIGALFIILIVLIVVTLVKNLDSLKMHSIFLSHSTNIFRQKPLMFLYILFYIVLIVGLIAMVLFQMVSFWASGKIYLAQAESVFYKFEATTFSTIMMVVVAVQFIWGIGFLKESFNFCITGNGVSYYFSNIDADSYGTGTFYPLKLQLFKHVGSVIGCSFMTSFFSLFDILFDLIKPTSQQGAYAKCFGSVCCCCQQILDLVRSDAMAFVCLTGNQFCNSARYCQYLCGKSLITDYSQSCSRIYRISAHFFVASLSLLFSIIFTENKSIYAVLLILVQALVISTFFISLHADAAEAIQILYLFDQQFLNRKDNKLRHYREDLGHATYRKQIAIEIKEQYDSIKSSTQ